jgi:hypothetical protein
MSKTNLTSEKGVSHVESFKVAGVTFNNRQKNLKTVLEQKNKGKRIDIGVEQYEYKGEPAISVTANGLDIGNLHKTDADYVLKNKERIIGFTDLFIDTFTNEEGKEIYYARVEFLIKNKAAVSSSQSSISADSSAQTVENPTATVSEQTNGKKPLFKNWKFWVAVGAGLTAIYIICVLLGLTKQ